MCLIKNFSTQKQKVFGMFYPRQPKLPSAGRCRAWLLEMSYPVVCQVYRIMGFVFEQIVEYFRLLGPFFNFFGLFDDFSVKNLMCLIKNFSTQIQ